MKKIKQYLESINLDYKKELTINCFIFVGILLVGVVSFIILKQIIILIIFFLLIGGFIFFLFTKYTNRKQFLIASHNFEFVTLMTYFKIYISDGFNVYSSLEKIKEYASSWGEERLEILLEEISNDKSVRPFINFANNFSNPMIENVVITIFQMIDQGEDEKRMLQFELLFNKLEEETNKTKLEKKKRSLDNLSIYPLIGAGYITILILFGIVSLMGKVIGNVI